jgi:c-di-GMP-binding flagellar brake protein YcgR
MALLHFRCKERRRTQRVALSVPLVVRGQTDAGEQFQENANSNSVSLHGAAMVLEATVAMGQTLILESEASRESIECRVVAVRRGRDGKTHVGVEFTSSDKNFWHMTFPVPGARPLRRVYPNKVTA